MTTERRRLLELAMESLVAKQRQIEDEIAQVSRELRAGVNGRRAPSAKKAAPTRRARFSRTERDRRSKRMKAYWDEWRKRKAAESR